MVSKQLVALLSSPRDNLSRMGLLKNPETTTVSGFSLCLKLCFGANLVQLSIKQYHTI